MQPREKILLGCLIAALVFWWGRSVLLSSFIAPLEDRERRLTLLLEERENRELEELQVLQASGQMSRYREQSLPADPNAAQRAYAIWLTDLLEDCGWAHKIVPGKVTRFQNLGSTVQVQIDGLATSEQLAYFLDGFEESGILHRLESLTLTGESIEPDSLLSVTLTAEALSLSASKREALEEIPATPELTEFWLKFAELSPFTKKRPLIVRNPQIIVPALIRVNRGEQLTQKIDSKGFASNQLPLKYSLKEPVPEGVRFDDSEQALVWQTAATTELKDYPLILLASTSGGSVETIEKAFVVRVIVPNTSPVLENMASQILYPEEPWTISLTATDRDEPAQQLAFSLTGTVPAGLTIDATTGLINWTPPRTVAGQNFSFTINATDNGDPPLKASQTLNLSVRRDTERSTYLIGCIQVDGIWTAWFEDREQKQRFAVKQGEQIQVGRFQAILEEVQVDSIRLTAGQLQTKLSLGHAVSDRRPVMPINQPSEAAPAATP